VGKDAIHDFEALVRRCKRGDDDAWHKLIARFRALVHAVATKAGLSHEEGNDAFQHTLLALLAALPRIRTARGLPKWIATTAARECLKIKLSRIEGVDNDEDLAQVVSAGPTPEALAIQSALAEDLYSAIAKLPAREMKLLHQLFISELTYKEIDETSDIPVGAIGPTRSRALRRVRDYLTAAHPHEDCPH
jgi:RNA polymerase sigma factor (sigma-70 family)